MASMVNAKARERSGHPPALAPPPNPGAAQTMRGEVAPQSSMSYYFSAELRTPADHPLRQVKNLA